MFNIGIILIDGLGSIAPDNGLEPDGAFTFSVAFVGHLMPGMPEGKEQKFVRAIAELGVTNVAILGLPTKLSSSPASFYLDGSVALTYGRIGMVYRSRRSNYGPLRGGSAKSPSPQDCSALFPAGGI